MRRNAAIAAGALVLLAGCGSAAPRVTEVSSSPLHEHPRPGDWRPATPTEWEQVIRDYEDGTMDDWHRCAAVRRAIGHLPMGTAFRDPRGDVGAYARAVCWPA